MYAKSYVWNYQYLETLRPEQKNRHFVDIFFVIYMNENCCILIQISLKFFLSNPTLTNSVLSRIMAWCWSHFLNTWWHSSLAHICVNRPRWVNNISHREWGVIDSQWVVSRINVTTILCQKFTISREESDVLLTRPGFYGDGSLCL